MIETLHWLASDGAFLFARGRYRIAGTWEPWIVVESDEVRLWLTSQWGSLVIEVEAAHTSAISGRYPLRQLVGLIGGSRFVVGSDAALLRASLPAVEEFLADSRVQCATSRVSLPT